MIMNKTKLLSIAVIILLLLNIGILSFLFFKKHDNHKNEKKMPKDIVIEKLHFDKNQIEMYEETIASHQKEIHSLDSSIKKTKNELYQLLNSETNYFEQKNSLLLKLADYQKQIETTHFNHFLEIKNICKEDQLADYELLTEELSKIFTNKRKPKRE